MLQTNTAIVCPNGKSELNPVVIDMTEIYKAEARIQEVAFVTPTKAPELLARFNEAYLILSRHITLVEHEYNVAEREANKVRSVVILDRIPVILKERGLATSKSPMGSEDLRNAILDSDDDYQKALERVEQIRCIRELMRGKLKAIEMAYTSVKKILGENSFNFRNNNLSGDSGDAGVGEVYSPSGFGKPRY